jgi:hypothetical protein
MGLIRERMCGTDRPLLTALALLAGFAASQTPRERLSEIIRTSAATEAGLDPASIGYQAPVTQVARVGPATSR